MRRRENPPPGEVALRQVEEKDPVEDQRAGRDVAELPVETTPEAVPGARDPHIALMSGQLLDRGEGVERIQILNLLSQG